MKTRSQAAVEIVLILSAVMIVLALIYFAAQQQLTESQNQVRVSQARLTVSTLARAAREVFTEGPGARRIVQITIPEGNVPERTGVFNDSVINVGLFLGGGVTDINEFGDFRVVEGANFPKTPGNYNVNIWAFEGFALLGDPSWTMEPGTIALQMLENDSETRTITVTNYNGPLDITLTTGWSNPGIAVNLNGSGSLTFHLNQGESSIINVNFVSTGAAFGTYTGQVNGNASNGENRTTFLLVQIVGTQPPIGDEVAFILIDTFADSGYTIAQTVFDPTETVDITGNDFAPNSLVSVVIRNSTGSTIFSGSNTSDGTGKILFYWNPGVVIPGTFNVTMNDTLRLNSTLFNISGCS